MKLYQQPTNHSCTQAATAMLLSHFDIEKTPENILESVPVRSWPGSSEPAGTPPQDVAAYVCKLGLAVEIVSFDVRVTDLSWQGKTTEFIEKRLKAASGKLTAPVIGRKGTELYIQAYIDYIAAGGKLSVQQAPTRELLHDLLKEAPFVAFVAYDTLWGTGKSINGPGLRESKADDILGGSANHAIVVSRSVGDDFEVYDPWHEPGIETVKADHLLAAIATAQQECDNLLIVVRRRK